MTDTLLVSTRKGLFEVRRHSSGWAVQRESFVGDDVTLALVDTRDGCWYAALEHGHHGARLHRSEDDGESWIEVGAPSYPPKPADAPELGPDGRPVVWATQRIWSLAAGGADRRGELWAGTVPGALFHSRDLGQSWQLVESLWNHPDRQQWFAGSELPGIHSILVDPRDSRRVLVGLSCGGLWETCDDGQTWALREVDRDPHRVVACPADFDRMWIQHHSGISRSRDGGRSWEDIKEAGPSTFGFAVAVHPREPDTAYFVPVISDRAPVPLDGRMVVTRTRDGGGSFDVLRNGLPQAHAYDLVDRHALALDRDGELLALGSTTGNLWVSEDGGDHFQMVSNHLPPIAALSFV